MSSAVDERVFDLMARYTQLIDDGQLESWLELFSDDCMYSIHTRENASRGMHLPLVFCDSKRSLQDRVTALSGALVYTENYARHILSSCRICARNGESVEVHAHFAVFQTEIVDGQTFIFVTGKYEDRIRVVDGDAKFVQKRVILDTHSIPNLIATPI